MAGCECWAYAADLVCPWAASPPTAANLWELEAASCSGGAAVFLACTAGSIEQQQQWLEQEVAIESIIYPQEAAQRRQGDFASAQDDLARQVGARLQEVQQVQAWVCLLNQGVTVLGSCLRRSQQNA